MDYSTMFGGFSQLGGAGCRRVRSVSPSGARRVRCKAVPRGRKVAKGCTYNPVSTRCYKTHTTKSAKTGSTIMTPRSLTSRSGENLRRARLVLKRKRAAASVATTAQAGGAGCRRVKRAASPSGLKRYLCRAVPRGRKVAKGCTYNPVSTRCYKTHTTKSAKTAKTIMTPRSLASRSGENLRRARLVLKRKRATVAQLGGACGLYGGSMW